MNSVIGSVLLAVKEVSHPLIVGILWLLAATSLSRCVPAHSPESTEALYSAQLLSCVEKSSSVDESRACRAQVNKKFGLCETPPRVDLCP